MYLIKMVRTPRGTQEINKIMHRTIRAHKNKEINKLNSKITEALIRLINSINLYLSQDRTRTIT
jgi:hypothetical protein